ncbi:heat shock factor protein 3-like [Polypterus senegalus]|uniref:heat shock factor protein 3-like n=1 Tax=Polypterus senegalus TaxID=55291 RepID=UPI001963C042|nr:heat shock factor protein 3-like [Polypterus senegalus]
MAQSSSVPGFICKLWALVEDPDTDDVICWSPNGDNVKVVEEQRFTKEILPRYFKHSNMSSFIRQLNMYGFRKVIKLDSGGISHVTSSTIEFHHPCFKRANPSLLENIRRKVSSVKMDDTQIQQEDLHRVVVNVQQMKDKQDNMEEKLKSLSRENKDLWRELAYMRRKHSQQQRLLNKVIQFIMDLVHENCIVGIKRKRSLMPSITEEPKCKVFIPSTILSDEAISLIQPNNKSQDKLQYGNLITDITVSSDKTEKVQIMPEECPNESFDCVTSPQAPTSNIVCDSVTDSFASDEAASKTECFNVQCIDRPAPECSSLIDRLEIRDFLNCIDENLEDLQVMLSGKQFNIDPDFVSDLFNPDVPAAETNMIESTSNVLPVSEIFENTDGTGIGKEDSESTGKRVVVYKNYPLLTLLDELCTNWDSGKANQVTPLDTADCSPLIPDLSADINPALPDLQQPHPDLLQNVDEFGSSCDATSANGEDGLSSEDILACSSIPLAFSEPESDCTLCGVFEPPE